MKDAFWGQIFCLLSAGGATIETIRQYIESQGHLVIDGQCRNKGQKLMEC